MDRLSASVFENYNSPGAEIEHKRRLGSHRWNVQEARWKTETMTASHTHTHALANRDSSFSSRTAWNLYYVESIDIVALSPSACLLSSHHAFFFFFYQWQEQTVIWRDDIPLIPPSLFLSLSLPCVLHTRHTHTHTHNCTNYTNRVTAS